MNRRRRRRGQRGMTLIEILVVIAILGAMMGLATVAYIRVAEDKKRDAAKIQINNFHQALQTYYLKKGKYPDTGTGLQALLSSQVMERIPRDPWDNEFVYLNEGGKPVIISYGKNGTAGGEGDDADISSKDDPQAKQ